MQEKDIPMATLESTEALFVTTALKSWDSWIGRADKLFDSLTDEQMLTEIAPGKNRPVYLLGHLIVVNDSMIPQLRLGEAHYEALREPFVLQPDSAAADLPPVAELRQHWTDLNQRLAEFFTKLTPAEWLERHATVSEEDFAREPHRNRLAILFSRTNHASYHLGQLMLARKK
jgi:DinB superfamily